MLIARGVGDARRVTEGVRTDNRRLLVEVRRKPGVHIAEHDDWAMRLAADNGGMQIREERVPDVELTS
eukprot:5846555-Pyramimonas_sp.AAC.1